MEHNFPSARFVVCNRHLCDKLTRKLDAINGARTQARKTIVDRLFGDSRLASADNVIAFDAAVVATKFLEKGLVEAPDDTRNYVPTRIVMLLRLNLSAGQPRWTNNNCEAINHVLKQSVQWQLQQLPMLIGHLSDLVDAQHGEADRAMCGRGDCYLAPTHVQHRHTPDTWSAMLDKQRQKAADACFKFQLKPAMTTSSDNKVTGPTTPGGGKKPHQRKRQRPERSTTVKVAVPKLTPPDSSDEFAD